MKKYKLMLVAAGCGLSVASYAAIPLTHYYHQSGTGGFTQDQVGTAHGTIYDSTNVPGSCFIDVDGSLRTYQVSGQLTTNEPPVPRNGMMIDSSIVSGVSGAFSISVWFLNENTPSAFNSIFSFTDNSQNTELGAGNPNYWIMCSPAVNWWPYAGRVAVSLDKLYPGTGDTSVWNLEAAPYLDNGVLHHVVFSYDGNTNITLFVDGAFQQTSGLPGPFDLSTMPYVTINGGSPWPDSSAPANTYSFAFIEGAVSLGEVSSLFALGQDPTAAQVAAVVPSFEIYPSPIGDNFHDENGPIGADILSGAKTLEKATLFIDGVEVSSITPAQPAAQSNAFFTSNLNLPLEWHTARVDVVSVENSPAIDASRTWTFRVEGIDAAWVQPMVNGNNDWNTTNGTMTFVAYTVDGASEVVSAALVINGVTNSTALVPGLNGTNTITFVTNGMANGAYTADVVSVGINPAITQTNGTVAWSIVEGVAPITLVHHWDFEEGSGTTVADVQGGASWDGAIVGTNHVWISGGLNLLGGGESSNHNPFTVTPTNHAVGSYVNLPNGVMSSLGTGPVTVEATYSATTDWGWMRVWDFGETENGILEEDYSTAGGTSFFFASSDWNRAKGAIQTNLTGWVWPEALEMWDYLAWDDQRTEQLTHVVWTFEPGVQTKLYMNGVLADLKLAMNWNFTQLNDINNYLGRAQWGPDGMMEGRLYDLRIYTGVMPYGQVIARWNQEKPNPATIAPNLQSIGKSAGNVALTWTSEDRVYYNILGRASLGDSWATNKANVLGDPVNTSYQMEDSGDTGFYMIEGVQ